ncbi:MAG: retropepsin-like domain-containing protein [Acidobacteriaceae bacterium]|nr:retropepsin-like domain-containing protein [Acidobacteriaceae bacterium]
MNLFRIFLIAGYASLAWNASAQSTESAPSPPQRSVHTQITAPDPENPAQANAQPSSAARTVEIPLLDCAGLPCIEMSTGSGKTLKLAIDTGEVNSYLDTKVAQSLELELKPLKGASDSSIAEVETTVVPGAKLGDLAMGDFPFMTLDTNQPDKAGQKPEPFPADGVLTYRAFQNRLLQLDYARHLVRVSEPQDAAQPCPHACSDLVVKHVGAYGPATLTASGFSINGIAVDAQVDTMFTGSMLVYPPSVEKLGLKKAAKSKHKELFPYVENGIKLARFDGSSENFRDIPLASDGPLYFFTADDHPPAVPFDVTVGSGLLQHAVVTLDFKGMHLWMDTPGSGAPGSNAPQL